MNLRISKEVNNAIEEMEKSHGVCVLRKSLAPGHHYEYVFITTPKGHQSHHPKKPIVTEEPIRKAILSEVHNARRHQLEKKIHEHSKF